jgi:Fe-S-cluster-containing hydrogenase component 2
VNHLQFHAEKCIACDMCAQACSLSKLERVQPAAACIKITRDTSEYLGGMRCSVCDISNDRACVDACPQEALVYDETADVVRFVEELCTDCGNCLEACPHVHIDAVSRRIMICDLCDGDPLCVQWCPEGALTWEAQS